MYPGVTLHMNRFGHIEAWIGKLDPRKLESDVYFQCDTDIYAILGALPADERDDLDAGWVIWTNAIDDDYFAHIGYHEFSTPNGNYRVALRLRDPIGGHQSDSHQRVAYRLVSPVGEVIFSGDDFGIPVMRDPISRDAALELLAFLTLGEGDVESEFFSTYTERQLQWRDSADCPALAWAVADEPIPDDPDE